MTGKEAFHDYLLSDPFYHDFIMVAPAPHLDGQYAAFGQITEGQDIAIDISRVQRNMMNDKPKKDVVIASIRVDTQGVEYPEPETH